MLPTAQKALVLAAAGAELAVTSWPVYTPGPGQALLKVLAVGLNPIDWKMVKLPFFQNFIPHPGVIGMDAAGEVVALGEGATSGLKPGDRVLWQGSWGKERATYQQYALADAAYVAKIPPGMSVDAAASVPSTLTTAFLGLYGAKKDAQGGGAGLEPFWRPGGEEKYRSTPIVVFGGATSVGQFAIQLAKNSGFSPIITTASPHNAELLTSLGATHVLPRTLSLASLPAEIAKLTDAPVRVVYDAVSQPDTLAAGLALLAPRGTLIHVLRISDEITAAAAEQGKELAWVYGSLDRPGQEAVGAELYAHLEGWLRDGIIKPPRVQILPNGLAGIADGLKLLQENKVSGTKLIAHPHD